MKNFREKVEDCMLTVEEFLALPDTRTYNWVRFNPKSETIEVKMFDNPRSPTYDIPLKKCQTATQCLNWIHQLNGKRWFDGVRSKEFLNTLFQLVPKTLWR